MAVELLNQLLKVLEHEPSISNSNNVPSALSKQPSIYNCHLYDAANKSTDNDLESDEEHKDDSISPINMHFNTQLDLGKPSDANINPSNSKGAEKEEKEKEKDITSKMKKTLYEIKTKLKELLQRKDKTIKTKGQLSEECQDETCCSASPRDENNDYMNKIGQLKENCQSLKRLDIMLDAYHFLIHSVDKSKWNEICISDLIQIEGQYEHQQLMDDFYHIKIIHIEADNNANRNDDEDDEYYNIARALCKYFAFKFKCDTKTCIAFLRHHQEPMNDSKKNKFIRKRKQIEDAAFQRACDKIHSYFFHSTIKFGTEAYQTNVEQEKEIDEINRYAKGRSYSRRIYKKSSLDPDPDKTSVNPEGQSKHSYVGKKEDDLWWKDVTPNQYDNQSMDKMYHVLVRNMGVFRWQNAHGFKPEQNVGTAHFKQKFQNIKQEALENEYEPLSKDNWNQTLRKARIFFDSWVRQKIRTKYKGYYDDQLTGQKHEWEKGVNITIQEIVTLKLYTDFDKLQFALKKCFRFETIEDILKKADDQKTDENNDDDNESKTVCAEKQEYEKAKDDLANRLENFYHWRGGLLIVLNKFGTKLNLENNMVLYHGVNAKMIIKPSQTFAFNGPLSTSSSYHVARTFATAKGMVLKITSHFPRLNYCNAFDASLISDYPEEQEWLVGFMYVRLLEVRTRKLLDKPENFYELIKKVPLSSLQREVFFAIHLFNEQIFSMSEHLERIIAQYLKVNRKGCCENMEKYKHQHDQFKDWDIDAMASKLCKLAEHQRYHLKLSNDDSKKQRMTNEEKEDSNRKEKMFPFLWKKFEKFRKYPNKEQRIKFDKISDRLKRFFMEETDDKDINKTDECEWSISFDEITTVYPNIKEIHFVNQYKFDDKVLKNLIQYIQKRNDKQAKEKNETKNRGNSIQQLMFLYYNYKDANDKKKPLNCNIFKDPDDLDETLKAELKNEGWEIKHNKNGQTGYKIRIYRPKK